MDHGNRSKKTPDAPAGDGIPSLLFWRAWLLVVWDTGFRVSELHSIRRDQIDDDGKLTITLEKTGRMVTRQLSPATIKAIDDLAQYPIRFMHSLRNSDSRTSRLL